MNKRRFATGAISIALAVTMLSITAVAASDTAFTDVPDGHWAAPSISEMAEKGVVSGVGNNLYAPSQTLSNAEFLTMLVRQFYKDKIGTGGDKWYSAYVNAADAAGIRTGTSMDAEAAISRYDMAQLMYNVMKDKGMAITSLSDTSKVSDWASVPTNYREAVSACYAMGMLSGVDGNGTFNGTGSMDRAQAAVVMDRLIDSQGTTLPEPTPPASSVPEGAKGFTTMEDIYGSVGMEVSNGIYHLNPDLVNYGGGGFTIESSGYSKVTFTIQAKDQDTRIVSFVTTPDIGKWDNPPQGAIYAVKAGETKTLTFDATGSTQMSFNISIDNAGGADFSECWISNLYLTK